jgi:hypothetical protein
MSPARPLLPALGLALSLVAGCTGNGSDRDNGDPVTAEESDVLAQLLVRNQEVGGADFVVTAPYGEDTVLTLTGSVDFAGQAGGALAVTTYGDGRAEDTRSLFFTATELWFGDVPGLPDALTAAGLPEASYVRRPLTLGEPAPLTDVLVRMVLNLSAEQADDPGVFRADAYSWQGDRSVDGELTAVYASESGWSVAVDSSTDLLVQFEAPLPDQGYDVTVTLADHGPREISLPGDEEAVDGAAHPEIAATVGL